MLHIMQMRLKLVNMLVLLFALKDAAEEDVLIHQLNPQQNK